MKLDLFIGSLTKKDPFLHRMENKTTSRFQLIENAENLWVYLHLPYFSIEVLTRNTLDRKPCVLVTKTKGVDKVEVANPLAQTLGIRLGMTLQSFYIDEDIQILQRNEKAEDSALESLCTWALQFTPKVSKVGYQGLLLEVSGSLKLFDGIDQLLKRMVKELKSLGYKTEFAVAPVPSAAIMLGKHKPNSVILNKVTLKTLLFQMPISVLPIDHKGKKIFKGLGVRTLGDCRRLPRDGLRQRFSSQFVKRIDCLFGDMPEYVKEFLPLDMFDSIVYFPDGVEELKSIVIAARNLLRELRIYLFDGRLMPSCLSWQLENSDSASKFISVNCDKNASEESIIQLLLCQISARKLISRPVHSIGLKVLGVSKITDAEADFFQDRNKEKQIRGYQNFILEIKKKLGEGIIFFLERVSSYRPEENCYQTVFNRNRLPSCPSTWPKRPLWLVRKPVKLPIVNHRPVYQGALVIRLERERILSNWWESTVVARDYFMAFTSCGKRVWIYKEIGVTNSWYLQGVFD